MLALYRCGRQSEALDAYADARQTLVSELGLEPGPELQELQQAILSHDESLRPPETPARRRRRRWIVLVATAICSALVAAALAAVALRDDDAAGSTAIAGEGTVVGIDAGSGESCAASRPDALRPRSRSATARSGSWMRTRGLCFASFRPPGSSRRSRPARRRRTSRSAPARSGSPTGGRCRTRSSSARWRRRWRASIRRRARNGRRSAWLAREGRRRTSSTITSRSRTDALWAVAPDFSVVRADATTGAITRRFASPGGGGRHRERGRLGARSRRLGRSLGRALGEDRATSVRRARLGRIDRCRPERGLGHDAGGRKALAHRCRARRVRRSDPARTGVGDLAVTPTAIWVANPIAGTLTVVDPETTRVIREIDLEGIPRSLAIDGDTVWVDGDPRPGRARDVRGRSAWRRSRRTCASRGCRQGRPVRTSSSPRTCRCREAPA